MEYTQRLSSKILLFIKVDSVCRAFQVYPTASPLRVTLGAYLVRPLLCYWR